MCFYLFRCIAKPQPVVTNLPFKIALIKIESLHKIKKNRFAGNLLNTIRVYLIKLYIIYRITTNNSLHFHWSGLWRLKNATQTAGRTAQLAFGGDTQYQTFLVIPLGEYTLVQIHKDGVHGAQLTVKHALHVAMSSYKDNNLITNVCCKKIK